MFLNAKPFWTNIHERFYNKLKKQTQFISDFTLPRTERQYFTNCFKIFKNILRIKTITCPLIEFLNLVNIFYR